MKKMSKSVVAFLVLILVGGCISQPPQSAVVEPQSIDDIVANLKGLPIDVFFEESYKQLLLRDPEELTALGLAEEYRVGNDKLANISDTYIKETQQLEVAVLELLRLYDRFQLTPEQQISYDVYEWYLDDLVRGHEFMYYDYPLHHFLISYHDELIRLFTEYHPLANRRDAEDYISRLSHVDDQVEQLLEGLRIREELGVIPPKFIIEMTRTEMVRFLQSSSPDPLLINGKWIILYSYFEETVEEMNLSEEEKQNLCDAALKEVEESVIPAYVELFEYLEHLKSIATDDAGVWKFPRGDEYYQYMIRHETSTELTPEEVHQLGLAYVEHIQAELRRCFDELGYLENESFARLMARAITEGGLYDTRTQSGKDQVIVAYETLLDEVDQKLDGVFDTRPRAEVIVIGDTTFGGGGGYYVSASLDGSRPGAFHTGVGGSYVYKYRMPTIAYHEAIPGHHFQISIAQEMDLPLFQNTIIFNGYAEGWALYAEQLAWELGLYEDNLYGNIGRLQMDLLRAVRLVADSGIHAKKWTREEATAYMRDVFGTDMYASEVDRYIVLPAQATGYKIGMIKILELRQKAMDELGDKFDIKEFHQVILGGGGMPLTILEKVVQDYIDAKLGNPRTFCCICDLPSQLM
jgi:uncharacterized protein (DUF885 family)